MCHNADLVLRAKALPSLSLEALWEFLRKRAGQVTGVVLTGGEPTLQPDLSKLLREVRALGYAVKLDTNGYRPDALAELLGDGLVDYVAMDVKAPPEKYATLTGIADLDLERIQASLEILRNSEVACEFRTTVVPGMLDEDDLAAIARWLSGCGNGQSAAFVLQQFRSQNTLDPDLADAVPYPRAWLRQAADRARRWLPNVSCRGI
jgi:pyruvate formate lyase activating enzyme